MFTFLLHWKCLEIISVLYLKKIYQNVLGLQYIYIIQLSCFFKLILYCFLKSFVNPGQEAEAVQPKHFEQPNHSERLYTAAELEDCPDETHVLCLKTIEELTDSVDMDIINEYIACYPEIQRNTSEPLTRLTPIEELNEDDLLEHEPVSHAITAETQPVLFPVADEMEIEVDAQALYIEEYPTSVPQGDGCFVSLRKPSKLL